MSEIVAFLFGAIGGCIAGLLSEVFWNLFEPPRLALWPEDLVVGGVEYRHHCDQPDGRRKKWTCPCGRVWFRYGNVWSHMDDNTDPGPPQSEGLPSSVVSPPERSLP